MNFALLTQAAQEVKAAVAAAQAGKKFTALKHGGQATVYVGEFGAGWQGEDLSSIAMSEDETLESVIDRLDAEISAPRASEADAKLSPIALFLLQLALRKLFERILK